MVLVSEQLQARALPGFCAALGAMLRDRYVFGKVEQVNAYDRNVVYHIVYAKSGKRRQKRMRKSRKERLHKRCLFAPSRLVLQQNRQWTALRCLMTVRTFAACFDPL